MEKVMHDESTESWSYLKPRTNFITRHQILELVVQVSHFTPGNIVEFGVEKGRSTRTIRKALTKLESDQIKGERKKIFACDSFKGLPEKFENAEIGAFACKPPNISGVEIVEGYFEESLNKELAQRVGSVSFASLDADLYSSTLCALRWLTPLLHTGSFLLFDEFLGESQSEKRAFEEWSRESQLLTIKVAEFIREPSGWGTELDKRVLFQVVKSEEISRRYVLNLRSSLKNIAKRAYVKSREFVDQGKMDQ